MPKACLPIAALAIILVSSQSDSVLAQAPVPLTEPPNTLWRFLGIPQTLSGGYDALANRRGNRPGLERRGRDARVRKISDPAFLDPAAPPLLKTAAQIKMQEDLAPQKIKALKYLGSIGCGCYDKDGEVTAALLAGLADCTEEVRLAAVETISEGARSEYCEFCRQRSCCKPALAKKLDELANGQDENGCWLEPSERVRAAAARALASCGPIIVQSRPVQQQQGGGEDLPPVPGSGETPPAPPLDAPADLPSPQAGQLPPPIRSSRRPSPNVAASAVRPGSPHPTIAGTRMAARPAPEVPTLAATEAATAAGSGDLYGYFQPEGHRETVLISNPQPVFESPQLAGLEEPLPLEPVPLEPTPEATSPAAPAGNSGPRPSVTRGGVIEAIDKAQGVVRVRFKHDGQVSPGTPVSLVHHAMIGEVHVSARVDRWDSGVAIVRPFKKELTGRLARGDVATLYVPQPVRVSR